MIKWKHMGQTITQFSESSSAPIIEQCTEQHRTTLLRWLHDEYVDSGCGFWANHAVIEESPLTDMFVAIIHGEPTAFALLGNEGIDILCTRMTYQGSGIGRTLARAVIEELWSRGLQAITISCSPPESFGFWQRLGFERVDPMEDAHLPFYARLYRSVRLAQTIDETAVVVAVEVQLLNPKYFRGGAVEMRTLRTVEMNGLQLNDRIYLPERIVLCRHRTSTDAVVKIIVDGVVVHQGRLKYLTKGQHGVQQVTNNQFFVDCILRTDFTSLTTTPM